MRSVVRRANHTDAEAISAIGRAAWPGTYAFAGQEYIEHGLATWWSAAAVERGIAATTTLVAETDHRVVGVGNVDLRPETPVIWKLYVLPDHQGMGIGSTLLRALIEAVPAERRTVAIEYVDGNDRAAAIYARHGFVVTHHEPPDRPEWPGQIWAERPTIDQFRLKR